jgi:hypothetical protein
MPVPPPKLPRKKRGEPVAYSEALADKICLDIASGMSMTDAAHSNGVNNSTLYFWLTREKYRDDFYPKYMNAKKLQAELISTEIIKLSDDRSKDYIIDDKGNKKPDLAAVQRSRLMVESRKYLLSKMLPRVYGEKLALTDGDGQPVTINLPWLTARKVVDVTPMSQQPLITSQMADESRAYDAETSEQISDGQTIDQIDDDE